MPLGTEITSLVAGPDGGAWFTTMRGERSAIAHVTAAGEVRSAGVKSVGDGVLGPDGQAWYGSRGADVLRSDAAGRITRVPTPRILISAAGTGADGRLWVLSSPLDQTIDKIAPDGKATEAEIRLPECRSDSLIAGPSFTAMARASDDAMWLADSGCERLIRITGDAGTGVPVGTGNPAELAADASGGVWFTRTDDVGIPTRGVGHADAAGTVRSFTPAQKQVRDVAVAPDGSAWFATGECTLARVTPSGEVSSVPAPIPARRLAFDPSGGLWLASAARVVRLAPGEPAAGGCDDQAPDLKTSPGRDGGTVTLRQLRRAGGFRLTVREPVWLSAFITLHASNVPDGFPYEVRDDLDVVVRQPATRRHRLRAATLRGIERRLAGGHRVSIALYAWATDREGNRTVRILLMRVRR